MPSITQPASFSDTKTFGCLCCTSGPLTSSVYLPRVGYAPGEGIPVSAEVENLSNKTMNKTQAKLIQDIVFRGHCEFQERSKHITRIIQVTLPECKVCRLLIRHIFNIIYTYGRDKCSCHVIKIKGSQKRRNRAWFK